MKKARVVYDPDMNALCIEIYSVETDSWDLFKMFSCWATEEGGPEVFVHMDIVHELLQLINLGYTVSGI